MSSTPWYPAMKNSMPTSTLPDPEDRHVLAAAIHGGADIIVTLNLRHFPPEALEPYKIVAQPPDAFVCGLLEADAEFAVAAFAADRARLRNPAMSPDAYMVSLERAGLKATGAALRTFIDAL